MADLETTRVLFRLSGNEVIAVFPDLVEGGTYLNTRVACYAHVGQHSVCTREWYGSTRPALPEQYASLKAELEAEPYGYRLEVIKRWTAKA